MPTVTYKAQPGIHKTRGAVPLSGTEHVYRVGKVLWPEAVSKFLVELTSVGDCLHVCCGHSPIGRWRLDMDSTLTPTPTLVGDAASLPFLDHSVDVVLCDPPYNGKFQWNHDMLSELCRVARKRIVFQHWFLPTNKDGGYKKMHDHWSLSQVHVWQPRTYFGRVQVISVFDWND